jgi:tRNA (mo5U34)-methyltransferase
LRRHDNVRKALLFVEQGDFMNSMERLTELAVDFRDTLGEARAKRPDVKWYDYGSLDNFWLMQRFTDAGLNAFDNLENARILDVGAADGETSFFLERQGGRVSIVDNPQTNANDCQGIAAFRDALASRVDLQVVDLDFEDRIEGQYDLVIFLGILYHLRNPVFALTNLAHHADRMLMSTTVMKTLDGHDVSEQPVAWFHECREINDDPTNYWQSSPRGLRLALKRSGWIVKDEFIVDADGHAAGHRMSCYCERVPDWANLKKHHDF